MNFSTFKPLNLSTFQPLNLSTVLVAALCAATSSAAVVEETVSVAAGWNAVYIESTPDDSDAAAFFAPLGVTKASCYVSGVYSETAQISSDGSEISQKPVSHFVFDANDPRHSTMHQVSGGLVYLLFATNAAQKTFLGTPQIPRVSWQVSDGGFATFAPVLAPKGETVLATDYFDGAPCGADNAFNARTAFGSDAAAPTFAPISAIAFTRKPKVTGGLAYALGSDAAGEWPGVVKVTAGLNGSLSFPDGVSSDSFEVRNMSSRAREVRVSLRPSARASEAMPALSLYVPGEAGETSRWEEFSGTNVTLAAGESRTFVFRCDKAGLAAGDERSGIVAVEDLGGSLMRLRFPVTAEGDTVAAGEGAYPTGLWIGSARVSQVSGPGGGLMGVGQPLKATILLHVDAQGGMTLLQRVVAARVDDGAGGKRDALYRELSDVPAPVRGRRISCVFLDTANRAVPATANADASGPEFGREATFRFTVDGKSKENPFRHPWHPDHDGKSADYSGDAPSGDAPENFIGPVKPESFSVTNTMVFAWRDDNGLDTYSRTIDETTFGRLDWTLSGLSREPIAMRAVFALRRVSGAAEIEGETP